MAFEQDPTDPTGIKVTSGEANTAVVRARDRKAAACLDMRLAGYEWDDIAEVVGFPDGNAAQVAFENARERHLKENPATQTQMRDLAGRRLERLLRAVWHKAIDPDNPEQLAAQDRALRVITNHAKLYGLEAPTEINLHGNPSEQELQRWVASVIAVKDNLPEEIDILEGDVVEDGPEALEA